MTQNTSHAVMQQRTEALDSLDDFPTPPWATRALMEHVIKPSMGLTAHLHLKQMTVWEPAANRGYMAAPLTEYFGRVIATDVHQYGSNFLCDFLIPGIEPPSILLEGADWIISNPPFRLAIQFIERARAIKGWKGTAMLVRSAFLEGEDRYKRLFSVSPPSLVAQFAERVVMHKGVLRDPAVKYWNPNAQDPMTRERTGAWVLPSTATSYCWLVWMENVSPKPMIWIPPCRKKLERPGDYPTNTSISLGGESNGAWQDGISAPE